MSIELGKTYDSTGPDGEPIVIMLKETWTNLGTYIESQRQIMSNQDKRLKDVLEINEEISRRLENLRAIRREEKRPEVESFLNIPKG